MNDTIMASVAALKSRTQDTSYSLYTGFRSVRSQPAGSHEKSPNFKSLNTTFSGKTTVVISLDNDVLDRLKSHGKDHHAKIRAILRDYVEAQ